MKATRYIKIISLVLCLMSFVLLLCACGGDETETSDAATDEIKEESGDMLTLIENGEAKCTVVYSMSASKKESTVAFGIASTLKSMYGAEVTVTDDFGVDEAVSTDDVEILVGNVKRTEAQDVCATLVAQTDIAVAVRGNKLVIAAKNDEGYDRALSYLEDTYFKKGDVTLAIPRTLSHVKLLSQNPVLGSISDYTIVYPAGSNARLKTAAEGFNTALAVYTGGQQLTVTSDATVETTYEILLGDTNRTESKNAVKLDYYDYLIREVGNKIVVNVGGSYTAQMALDKLVDLIVKDELDKQFLGGLDKSLFNPLAYDQSTFVPAWQGSITVPSWMTDFNEKLYAITNPSGRPMCVSHRGDVINYPEDSLEGILSASMLGADVIELDVMLTKDNVLVLCHDETLTNTTNVNKLKGKNGLPDSVYVRDWTYEQIQELSLLDRSGNVTKYKMPSYYEMLMTMRGRCFVMVDVKVAGSITKEDVFELATAADALELSIYSMFVASGSGPAQANSYSAMINYAKAHPELTRFGEIAAKLNTYMSMSGHSIRKRGWLDGSATTNPYAESHDRYLAAYSTNNLRLIYTNNIPLMSTFIAKYQPDLK